MLRRSQRTEIVLFPYRTSITPGTWLLAMHVTLRPASFFADHQDTLAWNLPREWLCYSTSRLPDTNKCAVKTHTYLELPWFSGAYHLIIIASLDPGITEKYMLILGYLLSPSIPLHYVDCQERRTIA
ncbi:hypothetical protein EYC84_001962 [Monilinia fructicola]|uniref:Uncharacterized protein n=1 Tax=Monilinia fructicola TaxID=38448 RepID=A0A5M9JRA7_MONFR|nr:hypothetical protein EYC84_001962 [Monilinia fructicola]